MGLFSRTRHGNTEQVSMDSSVIAGAVEGTLIPAGWPGTLANVVLFKNGELRRVEHARDIFGLVLVGFQGFHYGDGDGSTTAYAASELPLDLTGEKILEVRVKAAVQEIDPTSWAFQDREVTVDEAELFLSLIIRRSAGMDVSGTHRYSGGEVSLGAVRPIDAAT